MSKNVIRINSVYDYGTFHKVKFVLGDGREETISFQHGPRREVGVNGIQNEDLIQICIDRLKDFQSTKYKCPENAQAIVALEQALMFLDYRTAKRVQSDKEGTSVV